MKEQLAKLLASFRNFWNAQEKKRKITYISIIVAVLLIGAITAIILNHKDYVVLYQGLDATESAEIVSEIQALGYEVSLRADGTIVVPKGTEDTLTMQMAEKGYPKSNLDYKLYTSNVDMFSTESEKNEYARMALESRLSAIIGSLDNVDKATVTLSIPEQQNTVITSLKKYPTASVVVYVKNDGGLSPKQIDGITYIVKRSVSGLEDENISIVDGDGVPQISGDTSVDLVADITRKLAFKTNLENTIKQKIQDLLIPVYSEDGFSVAVNMVLNFDKKVSENTNYSADGNNNTGVLQQAEASDASGNNTAQGGVAGVETNADDTYPTGDTTGNGAWTENSLSNTYLVDTYKEQIEKAGYTIDSLSISVVIYTDYISDAQKQDLVKLVANAGSVNPTVAQDVVTVTNFAKFADTSATPVAAPVYLFGLTLNQLIIAAAALLVLLMVLIVALVIGSKNAKKKRRKFEQQVIKASKLADKEDEMPVDTFTSSLDANNIEIQSLMDDTIDTKEKVVKREIGDFAKHSPDIVAQLLKSWMREEDEK